MRPLFIELPDEAVELALLPFRIADRGPRRLSLQRLVHEEVLPRQWSVPREITGSWSTFDQSGGCGDYEGWYPTFMSPARKNGHLAPNGYVFYLWGCQTGITPQPPGRQYSTRAFTMTIAPSRRRAARHQ